MLDSRRSKQYTDDINHFTCFIIHRSNARQPRMMNNKRNVREESQRNNAQSEAEHNNNKKETRTRR